MSDKLDRAVQSRRDRHAERATKVAEKLNLVDKVASKKEQMKQDIVMRAKDHSEKVIMTVKSKRERELSEQKVKEHEILVRQKQADELREAATRKKIVTAQAFQAKRSASKEASSVSPTAEQK